MAITTRGTVILAVGSAVAVTATAAVIYQQRSQEAAVEESPKAEDFVEGAEQVDADKGLDASTEDAPKEEEEVEADVPDVPEEEIEMTKGATEASEEPEVASDNGEEGPSLTSQAPRPSAAKRASNAPEELKKWLSSWTKTPEETPKNDVPEVEPTPEEVSEDDDPEAEPTPEEVSEDNLPEAEPTPEEAPVVSTGEAEPTSGDPPVVETPEESHEPVETEVEETNVVAESYEKEEFEEEVAVEEQPSTEEVTAVEEESKDEAPLNPEEIKESSEVFVDEVKSEAPLNPEEIKESIEAPEDGNIQESLKAMGIEIESPVESTEAVKEAETVPVLKQVETESTDETSLSNGSSNSDVSTDLGASSKSQPVVEQSVTPKKKKRNSISKVLGKMTGSSRRRISKKEYSKRWSEIQTTSN